MSVMLTKLVSSFKVNNIRSICTAHPHCAYWNKDWMPGSFPTSKAEKEKAAKKYNLHPKEYEPYADDGFGHGDYPKLPWKGTITRDPHYPYDNPEYKRNFGEPIHVDLDMIGEDRFDAGAPDRYSPAVMIASFVIVWGTLFSLCYLSKCVPIFQPVMEKQYPWKGKTYYTFEKVDKN